MYFKSPEMSGFTLFFLVILLNVVYICQAGLNVVQDEELMDLIRSDPYIVTLFSRKDCSHCDDFENILDKAAEELTNNLDSKVVKVINSQLTRLYSPTKEPVLVFFRHGIPLLYHGTPSEDLIVHTFLSNKEPVVKELNDATFEHLTQAASGATTGDWFVMFYSPDCVDCHRLQARWEAVGAQLKSRMNVARVNKAQDGTATARRFDVTTVPSFLFFRHGKMYRYQIQKYDIDSFISFAQDWYKNLKPERVPSPQTPFDEFVDSIVVELRKNPWLWQIAFITGLVGFAFSILMRYVRAKANKPKDSKPKAKKEDKEK